VELGTGGGKTFIAVMLIKHIRDLLGRSKKVVFLVNNVALQANMKGVTSKAIYTSRMKDLLIPRKVELKFPQVNFKELIYPRLQNKVLEVRQRDLLFSLTHRIYRNRARLFQQNRAEDDLCPNPACRRK
jgi:hypothetical protein